jgi:hypothetical protein
MLDVQVVEPFRPGFVDLTFDSDFNLLLHG